MKILLGALPYFRLGVASSNAATLLDKVRLASNSDFRGMHRKLPILVFFLCAEIADWSGSCVAQCAAEASSLQKPSGEPK